MTVTAEGQKTVPPTRFQNESRQDTSALARAAVSLEYASLQYTGHCPLGIYVLPSTKNLLIWDAVFFVHQGYYADSILKFRLTFPGNYPETSPVVTFLTDVLHPLISSTGEFNISPRFRPWRPQEHRSFDVLHWIKAAFKKQALDTLTETECLNKEAYRYHESTQSFAALATQTASLSQCQATLSDLQHHRTSTGRDLGEIVFKKQEPEIIELQRAKLGLCDWKDSEENAF